MAKNDLVQELYREEMGLPEEVYMGQGRKQTKTSKYLDDIDKAEQA